MVPDNANRNMCTVSTIAIAAVQPFHRETGDITGDEMRLLSTA